MKTLAALACLSVVTSLAAMADEPIPYAQGNALLVRYQCAACHDAYTTLKGPSLNAIARRYASDPTAQTELETMVVNGSSGVWGDDSGMPPNEVPAADLHRLVQWILSFRTPPMDPPPHTVQSLSRMPPPSGVPRPEQASHPGPAV